MLAYTTGKIPGLGGGILSNPSTGNTSNKGQLKVAGTVVKIERADTPEKRRQGLSGRDSLATDSGMLFIFEKSGKYSFWMKGMKFALDFIWIKDKKVVDILKSIPPLQSGQKDETLPIYQPKVEVDSVLEVNGGFTDSHGIKIGDIVE